MAAKSSFPAERKAKVASDERVIELTAIEIAILLHDLQHQLTQGSTLQPVDHAGAVLAIVKERLVEKSPSAVVLRQGQPEIEILPPKGKRGIVPELAEDFCSG